MDTQSLKRLLDEPSAVLSTDMKDVIAEDLEIETPTLRECVLQAQRRIDDLVGQGEDDFTIDRSPPTAPPFAILDAMIEPYFATFGKHVPIWRKESFNRMAAILRESTPSEQDLASIICCNNLILMALSANTLCSRRADSLRTKQASKNSSIDSDVISGFLNNAKRALKNIDQLVSPRLINVQALLSLGPSGRPIPAQSRNVQNVYETFAKSLAPPVRSRTSRNLPTVSFEHSIHVVTIQDSKLKKLNSCVCSRFLATLPPLYLYEVLTSILCGQGTKLDMDMLQDFIEMLQVVTDYRGERSYNKRLHQMALIGMDVIKAQRNQHKRHRSNFEGPANEQLSQADTTPLPSSISDLLSSPDSSWRYTNNADDREADNPSFNILQDPENFMRAISSANDGWYRGSDEFLAPHMGSCAKAVPHNPNSLAYNWNF
ncbi:MAG: hypothetical protein Q9191_005029 [Dirinaria sp. TL-2023a]